MNSLLDRMEQQNWHLRQVAGIYPEPVFNYWWCVLPAANAYYLVLRAGRREDDQALAWLFDEIATQLWRELCWCRKWLSHQPFHWYQYWHARGPTKGRIEQVRLRWRNESWEEHGRQAVHLL